MKILYVTTIGGTMRFFTAFIQQLIEKGHMVDIACSQPENVRDCYREWNCSIYPLSCSRSPMDKGNLKAIKQIRKLVEENHYDIVHCHTPIAAACTRLACRKVRKSGTKVFYTAHGFHFYKGAPLKNWLLYYPIEKLCAHWTDVLLTMNQEDFALAQKKMKAQKVVYVPGVGIDLKKFGSPVENTHLKRQELGIPQDAKLLLAIGELIARKNHETVIRAVAGMDVYLLIAGKGGLRDYLQKLIDELGATDRIKLLGFRTDIHELCHTADAFVLSSFHEGLPVSLMEAMTSGLPCVVSEIRGNVDLIDDNGGICFDPHSVQSCKEAIEKLFEKDLNAVCSRNKEIIKNFSIETVIEQMNRLYGIQ